MSYVYFRTAVFMAAALATTSASAHAVCGDRIFPATLGIDDPGVGDELSIPTLTYLPSNSGGAEEYDLGAFSWSKTIIPNVAIVVSDGWTWQRPGGYGWNNLDTELQWGNFCWAEHELMATIGLDVNWANTGTQNQNAPFNSYTPVIDIGKGFGDLPKSLNILRPLAITAEISETFPGEQWTDGSQNATTLNGGLTVQYSLPYYNSHIAGIDNDFIKHLIPITEFTFSTPVSNIAPGTDVTTGTVQPGFVYLADKWQLALEAIIPINGASGHGTGMVASLDLYLDDILPDTLGKPILNPFGAK
jgi:hypothetical protein